MSKQAVLAMLYSRYTAKAYTDKKISQEDVQLMEQIFQMAPSSMNVQPWRLCLVSDPTIKNQLAEASWLSNREKIQACSHMLVFCAAVVDDAFLNKTIEDTLIKKQVSLDMKEGQIERRKESLALLGDTQTWAEKQVYLNFGFFMAALGMLQMDSTALEGIDKKQYDAILQQGDAYYTVLALAVGEASPEDRNNPAWGTPKSAKARFNIDSIVQHYSKDGER